MISSTENGTICYLIDSENIGDSWVDLTDTLKGNSRIIVFYTDNSMHISCEKVRKLMCCNQKFIKWVECHNGTKNALDFQLVTELGAMVAKGEADEYAIVSNDSGFDAVVSYWENMQVNVKRIKEIDCAKQSNSVTEHSKVKRVYDRTQPKEIVATVKVKTAPTHAAMTPTDVGLNSKTMTVLSVLCKSIPIEPSTLLNNALNLIFTPKEGAKIYNKLKQLPEYSKMLTRKLLPTRSERLENYISLVLKTNKCNPKHSHDIYEILLRDSDANPNAIRNDFIKYFGESVGISNFKVIKRHFAVIKRI
ncbi:MAG: hypothetical protein K2M82_07605 [Lachnospiraceae bacterium]|nr:hypothetical protein [Lachnospiraceae bacterium]